MNSKVQNPSFNLTQKDDASKDWRYAAELPNNYVFNSLLDSSYQNYVINWWYSIAKIEGQ